MASSDSALDTFGGLLMHGVRDPAIHDADALVAGRSPSVTGAKVRTILAGLGPEQIDAVLRVVPFIVDTTLHHLLWALEQERSIHVSMDARGGPLRDLRDVALGELQGYLEPWIMQFSKERYEPPV